MKEALGLITVALSVIGHTPYIIDTLKKKTKPHILTWLIWSIVTVLAFLGQWAKGGGAGSLTTGVTGVITIFIAILAFKNGTKNISKSDKVFFVAALFAIIPWYITKDPTISVVIASTVDAFAFYPTMRKTLKDPGSETLTTYIMNVLRHGLSIGALSSYNLATYIYPLILLVMNAVVAAMIIAPRLRDFYTSEVITSEV